MGKYESFLTTKERLAPSAGIAAKPDKYPKGLFPFQCDLTGWALKKGRAAIFADTGLGKTPMQLTWAEQAARRSLIAAPLAVAKQTVAEAEKWGIKVKYARAQADVAMKGITITNYEMLDKFDPAYFGAIVLDESSILKNFEGKTRTRLIEMFKNTPLRLCCTATPAPNDIAEIANHAEFLGIMNRTEMLATFFVHDDKGWRLKGHAREPFYRWLASWGMTVRKPSDLGYEDDGFELPILSLAPHYVESTYQPSGKLFVTDLKGIGERAAVRKLTAPERVAKAVSIIEAEPDEQWLVWCGLNTESEAMVKALSRAVEVKGSDDQDHKERALLGFAEGTVPILVTKAKIAGFGMNFQKCARMVFVGIGDSYETYYQSIRRCWRFGQTRKVNVHIVLTDLEGGIYENVLRKERTAANSAASLLNHVREYEKVELGRVDQRRYIAETRMIQPWWMENNANNRSIIG